MTLHLRIVPQDRDPIRIINGPLNIVMFNNGLIIRRDTGQNQFSTPRIFIGFY